MKTVKMKCIKEFNHCGLKLEVNKIYDVSHKDNGRLVIFTKRGWYEVGEWEEYLIVPEYWNDIKGYE